MKKLSLSLLFFMILFVFGFAENRTVEIKKWNPTDLEFKTTETWRFSPTDPFEVEFYAEITGPDNIKLTHPGFYDGDNVWKIRFAPFKEGEWVITTHSEVLELDNQQIVIECVKNKDPNIHGALKVNHENPHHFIYEDGTNYFPMGYEANWLFAMDMDLAGKSFPTINPFLEKLSGYGFNLISINLWAYDTNWRVGKTSDDDFGPALFFPWGGSHENPDFKRFNLAYWQHFDKVIETMNQRGIIADVYFKVYNKLVNWPKNNSPEDDLYFKWVIARYAAYPNIIWNLAKEAQYERSYRYKVERLMYIRETDPYKRLLTVHDDSETYNKGHYNELVDFRSPQEHKDVHSTILKQLERNKWPVFVVESGYEHGPGGLKDKTFGKAKTPEEVIKSIWEIQMTGAYNTYYYTYTAWDIIRPNDNPPGYGYVKKFKDFFSQTQYWLLKSNDGLVNSGLCLENKGVEYIAYQDEAKTFVFDIPELPKSYKSVWFQPLSGKYLEAGKLKVGKNELTPPAKWGKVPVVLHVSKK